MEKKIYYTCEPFFENKRIKIDVTDIYFSNNVCYTLEAVNDENKIEKITKYSVEVLNIDDECYFYLIFELKNKDYKSLRLVQSFKSDNASEIYSFSLKF